MKRNKNERMLCCGSDGGISALLVFGKALCSRPTSSDSPRIGTIEFAGAD